MSITRAPRHERRRDGALRRDPGARRIVRDWRRLACGERALVACSGGADSVALALVLAASGAAAGLAHIVHDMRPRGEALADAQRVRDLADCLDLPALVGEARHAPGENLEASLRRARYGALAELAQQAGAPVVASAHHADDQVESMLLALARGAGPRGLAGVAPRRPLAPGVTLIRPMLGVTRADAERICKLAGVEWADDPTNHDPRRARAQARAGAAPALADLRPGAALAAVRAGGLLRDAAGLVADRAREVFADALEWDRDRLRAERDIVVGEGLRRAALRLAGERGADRLGARRIEQAVRAIRSDETHPRRFDLPGGATLRVEATRVTMTPPEPASR